VIHGLQSRTARETSDEIARSRTIDIFSVEPMLILYQERRKTFRLIAATVGRYLGALIG